MDLIAFINNFKRNSSMLWVENDAIKLFVSDNFKSQKLKETINEFKSEIFDILVANRIFTKNDFLNKNIFRSNVNESVLSFSQERLWFIEQYEEGTNAYHMPVVYELDVATDKEGIKHALQQIVSRHEVLRSTIEQHKEQKTGIQKVHHQPLVIEEIVLGDTENYHAIIKEEINRPFDLSTQYPIRVKLYTIQSSSGNLLSKRLLLINSHHIANDGWSIAIFQNELLSYYEAYINKIKDFTLPALEIQYKDYAQWQKNYLTGDVLEKQLLYWKEKLAGYQALELPTDYIRPITKDYKGSLENFSLQKELSQKLLSLAQQNGVTLHSVMLSSITILLSKYSGQADIVIGSPTANRHHRQTEALIGFFVNTQANRILLQESQSFEALIKQVHQEQTQTQLHQDLPFEKVVDELGVERDTSRHPIFQVMFSVQRFDNESSLTEKKYLKPYVIENVYEVEKFDLSISIDDGQESFLGQISYTRSLFKKETITALIAHYIQLLNQLVTSPAIAYSKLSLLNAADYKKIIYDWNATDREYPKDKTITELFQQQVARTPANTALVFEGQALSYEELNAKSNQLARQIRKFYSQHTHTDLKADTLITICVERSLEMVVSILAVLKAGAAYVPIDPNYPQERIDYILEDTASQVILTQRSLQLNQNKDFLKEKILYVDLSEELFKTNERDDLPKASASTDLAYVIYTSGTTGKPKGVMIENHSVINLFNSIKNSIEVAHENDRILSVVNFAFDAFVYDWTKSLLNGATLFFTKNTLSNDDFISFVNENKITQTVFPAALLKAITPSKFPFLKKIISMGDANDKNVFENWINHACIINGYGPTEYTVCTTLHQYKEGDSNKNIGKSMDNSRLYLLDPAMQPVPVGVLGELYIGGAGLSRGYLNRSDLTAARFVNNPFATAADQQQGYTRLYKTGDVMRWLSDGSLEFVGRNDDQVKIQGYRIELGEIENALSEVPGIKQCCVLAKERKTETGSTKYIVAYYVLESDAQALTSAVIQDRLALVLPDYMLPATFVAMDSFPITMNGKLDKRALPEAMLNTAPAAYSAPTTELEIKLCEIFAQVLGLATNQIGTNQNFFRIGGNSILSIQLKQKLNALNEYKHTSIADLFKYNTIDKLIESIRQDNVTEYKLQSDITLNNNHEIAIIGMSGAFSGVKNISEFWQIISNQQEGTQFYNKEQCKHLELDEELLENPNYIPVVGALNDIELFDPQFWDLSPNEAKQLDPQIRKFVEHCWFALESSGYVRERSNHQIGVFAGSGNNNYFFDYILKGEMPDQFSLWEASISNSKDALATKTAFMLNLSGPANSINTACSTGLVTVVEACKNLQLGTCTMALAGGVSLSLPDQVGYVYQEGMILSKDGHCKTFDSDSSGTIIGSGVGVVVLKRLADAITDKDNIIGVLKGYATNNDGHRKTGYTAPSVIGQSECIINAQKMAGVNSDQIDFVECHGTATNLGDPIEVQALREAFAYTNPSGNKRSDRKTVLGSIKANIGHADSAAGTAGLIKVCAMLQNNIIPGQVNFNTANKELHLDQTNFEITKTNREWLPKLNKQRLAGVSSFGIGGTNAHVVIGDFIPQLQSHDKTETDNLIALEQFEKSVHYIICLSAKSRLSLELYKQALIACLTNDANNRSFRIRDIAYTLQEKREHFSVRNAYSANNIEELINNLKQDTPQANTEGNNKIVFMFPGQGAQYIHMAKSLYETEKAFKDTIDQCIKIANQHLRVDLYKVMYPQEAVPIHDINEIQWASISLFIIEYALAVYLIHLGVHADAYIGHSFGEYVAATLSGVFSLEDAIKVVITRGKLMQAMQPGCMLTINAEEGSIQSIVKKHNCEIAVINSIEDVVASGDAESIEALQKSLNKQNIPWIKINGSVAGHSKMMSQAAIEFESIFETIKLNKPTKDFVSNLTGEIINDEIIKASYWCDQLRNPVQFAKGINNLSTRYNHQLTFIEVGTGKGLSYFVNKHKIAYKHKLIQTIQLLPSAKEVNSSKDQFYNNITCKEDILAKLWMNGINKKPNEIKLFENATIQKGLPIYQFDFQRCWIEKSNTILTTTDKDLLIKKFKDEVNKSPAFTKDSAVILLEQLLTPTKEKASATISYNKIKILEDHYTETEYQIALIFADILGIEQISTHDDFFKIGGNSLLVLKLLAMLKKIDIDVNLQEVISTNTVNSIYKHKQNNNARKNAILVPLKINNSSNRNVFFIHAVGGTVIGYKELADKLDDSYNYYGIQNINIYGNQLVNADSLESLASIYFDEILKVQADGDYILGGASMGGTLAYEIACQLQEKGKMVKHVFMFDSWAALSKDFQNKDSFAEEMQRQQNEYGSKLNEMSENEKNNLMEAQWKLMQLLLPYHPYKINNAPVVLFKAQDVNQIHATNEPSENNGWSNYCNEIMVYSIPGDHVTILEGEGLKKICKVILKTLDLVAQI